MAVDTVENTTTQANAGRSQRKRAAPNKARARKAASKRRHANLRAATEKVLRQRKRTTPRIYDWTGETRTVVPRRFARVRLPRRSDFRAISEANPLVLGAVGVGIGMILAAIVPKRISARWRARTVSGLAHTSRHGQRR
jgi:hypothetical protein